MQKKLTALLLAVFMILSTVSGFAFDATFTDVPADAWEASYVYDLVGRGILSGYGDGTFGPQDTVKRAEYAKMLVGITETPIGNNVSSVYTDVPNWEWYFPYVCASHDFISGFTDRDGILTFKPENDATREVVTVALIKALNIDLSKYTDPTTYLSQRFSDVDTISIHNRVYIAAAVDKGYITGDMEGTFRGQDSIIRAEVVAVLCRAFPKKSASTPAVKETLTAFFMDVGQGDACLLNLPGGKHMLIDAGTAKAETVILSLLKEQGVTHLDYVIATHPHADHIGSMTAVLNNFSVDTLYMPEVSANTKTYERFLETVLSKNVPVVAAKVGVTITDIPHVTATFLGPVDNTDDLNNASAVLRLSLGEVDFLFTGDAEQPVEELMLTGGSPLDAEILKAGHHGSSTSSCSAFLSAVNPEIAVNSCGAGNSYGHPHQETLDAFARMGVTVYRTDQNGTIAITTDGKNMDVKTER